VTSFHPCLPEEMPEERFQPLGRPARSGPEPAKEPKAHD